MRKICLPFLATVTVCVTTLCFVQPATAQVPSIDDTMHVNDAIASVGDTVVVQFYLRNVDTLGAYSIRLTYDPTLIEPLTDTVDEDGEIRYYIEAVQLNGTPFEQFSGVAGEAPGVLTFLAADYDQLPSEYFLPGGDVVMEMPWQVKSSATPQTTLIRFENDPLFPQSFNTIVDIRTEFFKRPVLKDGIFTIDGEVCDCPFQGDADLDGFTTSLDMGEMIDILFAGHPDVQEPLCLSPRFDFDCDGFTTSLDLGNMIDYLFAGGDPPCDPCN